MLSTGTGQQHHSYYAAVRTCRQEDAIKLRTFSPKTFSPLRRQTDKSVIQRDAGSVQPDIDVISTAVEPGIDPFSRAVLDGQLTTPFPHLLGGEGNGGLLTAVDSQGTSRG